MLKKEMLRVAAYLNSGQLTEPNKLRQYGIAIVNRLESLRVLRGSSGAGTIDAVLLDPAAVQESDWGCVIQRCQDSAIGVVVLAKPNDTQFFGYLQPGVHGVIPANGGLGEIACALWSARHQAVLQRELATELNSLREERKNRKLIDQAVGIIASQSNISQAEALRNLRHAARNQRRSMHQLATVVVEAEQILKTVLGDGAGDAHEPPVVEYRQTQRAPRSRAIGQH